MYKKRREFHNCRHQPCGDFVFKLTADGVPEDGMADRQQQLEIKRQEERSKMRTVIEACFEDATVALKRSDIIIIFKEKLGIGTTKAYDIFNAAVKAGLLATNDNRHYFMRLT